MSHSRTGVLSNLLVDLFRDAAEIKRFVSHMEEMEGVPAQLPGDNVSIVVMADALAQCLLKRRQAGVFFAELAKHRPMREEEIFRVAEQYSTDSQPKDEQVIQLDRGPDLVTLTVVSRRTGQTWKVSLSKHRMAEHAARDIFVATSLKGDTEIFKGLSDDEYRLGQGEKRFKKENIGAMNHDEVAFVERRQIEFSPPTTAHFGAPRKKLEAPKNDQGPIRVRRGGRP